MNILLAGGAGYIGSHTCIELVKSGYEVIIVDDLSNSDKKMISILEGITGKKIKFYEVDCSDIKALEAVFEENNIDGIIHFAGLKAVGESSQIPLEYYRNNLMCTINLGTLSQKYSVNKFIFSSSATVYGDNEVPFHEEMDLLPTTNPYGETKVMGERILKDLSKSYDDIGICLLRYFNPLGAHESGLIGEKPNGIPNNLLPYVLKVAKGDLKELSVFGNDYDTTDGTGVRDYIHVVDLAIGHVMALEKIKKGVSVYNLGTGEGYSVLELVNTFEKVTGVKVAYKIVDRRPGDIATCYAGTEKAEKLLGWTAKKTLEDMCRDSWKWEQNNK